ILTQEDWNVVLYNGMASTSPLAALYFVALMTILGMHLFGCKFSLQTENGDTVPDRKNFDSLLWAIVTVFQILTQEDWNVVLYNGMASTSPLAALYFVALMTFGNYSDDEKKSDTFEEDDKVEQLRDTGK
ncbi:hypothetical protein CRUP_029549, partial [Coryphaenoides rupestris]